MDQLPGIPWNVSPMISRVPTFAAFQPLLEKNRPLINSVTKKTFKYGETDRHYFNYNASSIYTTRQTKRPPSGVKTPIFFFVYGGGFITGSRNFDPPRDLLYSCLGSFFARQGVITVIPDYRLAPEFKYPKAVEDVLQAIQWTLSHESELVSVTTPNPDLDSLFIMGHSAGAVHVATFILHPTLIPVDSDLRKKVKGIVLASGPYHYFKHEGRIFEACWGSEESAKEDSAVSLLINSFDRLPKDKLPKILLVDAQFEPEWIMNMGIDYQRLLEWHLREPVEMDVVKDHNHTSLNYALSSGEGEEWGVRTADWIKAIAQGNVSATGLEILEDIRETDMYQCSACQQRRTRSFSIGIGTQSVRSKTFLTCVNCGIKWIQSQSA